MHAKMQLGIVIIIIKCKDGAIRPCISCIKVTSGERTAADSATHWIAIKCHLIGTEHSKSPGISNQKLKYQLCVNVYILKYYSVKL